MWNYKKLISLEIILCAGTICLAVVRKVYWQAAPVAIGLLLSIGLVGQVFRLLNEKLINYKHLCFVIAVFAISLFIICILAYQIDMGHHENWHRYVLSYAIAICLFFIFFKAKKNIWIFSYIAILAYPLYLYQEIIFRFAFANIQVNSKNAVIFIVGVLVLLFTVSFFVHIGIEKPMINLGNKIENKLK